MQSRRLLATSGRGALAGGFTKDNLTQWAEREWGLKDSSIGGHYVDLLKHKVSPQCAAMLETHPHPSSALANAFFQSAPFTPERIIVTTLGITKTNNLPTVFRPGDSYLFWTAKDVTPHEIILRWKLGSSQGFTMVALDPRARFVYFGSGIEYADLHQGFLFRKIMTPFHMFYSNLLIKGMVAKLEEQPANRQERS
jgi:hypothetical protein